MTKSDAAQVREAFSAALPIMLGYVAIGIPCGILNSSIGISPLQCLAMGIVFYSGAGQFMIPNMWLAGAPLLSIIASTSLVNTRQVLYSASLAQYCQAASKRLSFYFAATVTDESFGVNMDRFANGDWTVRQAALVNTFSMLTWAFSGMVGVIVGNILSIPLALASFAMTSIFICLLATQNFNRSSAIAAVVAAAGVFTCKLVGLGGAAILLGALLGVASAVVYDRIKR